MGMFDNIRVLKALPLNEELLALNVEWKEEVFQTKDLENLLELYEITENGNLRFLRIEREWEKDEESAFGGYLKPVKESWEEVPFHGVVRFYTTLCDNPTYDEDLTINKEELSWEEIFKTTGNDWWIEFLAIFNHGVVSEIRLGKAEKTPISARLASNKEWSIKRQIREQHLLNRTVSKLRKIPLYRTATRTAARWEQKLHESISKAIRKIS